MKARTAVLIVLAAVAVLLVVRRPALEPVNAAQVPPPASRPAAVQTRPPMFSTSYVEALRGVLELEQDDVAQLERSLAANPEDTATRLKVMGYYQRADRSGRPADTRKRVEHALWLIEHHPDSEILHSHVSSFSQTDLAPADYQRAITLWNVAAKAQRRNAAVLWNAACFLAPLNPDLWIQYLESTAEADPNHPFALLPLAHHYGRSLLQPGPAAARAEAALEASKNVWVLGNAAYMLQSQYNQSLQNHAPNPRAAQLAERYFLRAKALDPKLEREKILPQIDMQEIARVRDAQLQVQRNFEQSAKEQAANILRLPISAFPQLPPGIAEVLRARRCTIPQAALGGPPHNVIRGEFFAKGQQGWAVYCSVNGSTALLAFRHDNDTSPQTVSTSEDVNYLQGLAGSKIGYSRQITTVGRAYIMRHYRAYGGPEPPPIDHQGINDAFVEKASTILYFHEGKWLGLQGAD